MCHGPLDLYQFFLLNLGIYKGNLVGVGCQDGLCHVGSFVNFDKSSKFKVSKNGNLGCVEKGLGWGT